jgi:DNA-binding transcriptional LysR family regulator
MPLPLPLPLRCCGVGAWLPAKRCWCLGLTVGLVMRRGAAESGVGIALLPYWLVRQHLNAGTLVQLLPDYPMASTMQAAGINFVYSLNRRQSRKVHAFMDHVSSQVSHLLT